MDLPTTLLSLSPFDLGQLGNDMKLPSPCLQLPLDNPPLSQKKKKKAVTGIQRIAKSDEANDHLLAFGMGHMDFLFNIFVIFICRENTCPCSEPSPEDNQWPEGNH